jgi:hypothetical protein
MSYLQNPEAQKRFTAAGAFPSVRVNCGLRGDRISRRPYFILPGADNRPHFCSHHVFAIVPHVLYFITPESRSQPGIQPV